MMTENNGRVVVIRAFDYCPELYKNLSDTYRKFISAVFTALIQLCKNYINLAHCVGQKFNVNVIKTAAHRQRTTNFLKSLISQEIFASIGFKKNAL